MYPHNVDSAQQRTKWHRRKQPVQHATHNCKRPAVLHCRERRRHDELPSHQFKQIHTRQKHRCKRQVVQIKLQRTEKCRNNSAPGWRRIKHEKGQEHRQREDQAIDQRRTGCKCFNTQHSHGNENCLPVHAQHLHNRPWILAPHRWT